MIQYFYKKKYILPFIHNLEQSRKMENVIFLTNYTADKSVLIMLCWGRTIFQITKSDTIVYDIFEIDEKNYLNWPDYKRKILLLKDEGKIINSQGLILMASEDIRHLSNQVQLSFKESKDILSFLFSFDKTFFKENNESVVLEKTENKWID